MKKLIKILGILLLLLVIVVGSATFFLDSIVSRFRPQIQAAISKTVGRPVTFGEIESQIFPSVAITLSDVAVSGSSGASVSSLALKTSLGELLSGEIAVSQLGLEGVNVNVERAKDGSLIVAGIPIGANKSKPASKPSSAAAPTEQQHSQTAPSAQESGSPVESAANSHPDAAQSADDGSFSLKVRSADISGVNVNFTDNAVNPPQTIAIKDLTATFKDIDTAGKANIDLTASLLGKRSGNIRVYGDLGNPLANFPINATIELNSLDLARLSSLAASYGADTKGMKLADEMSMSFTIQSTTGGISINSLIDGSSAEIAFGDMFRKPSGKAMRVDSSITASLAGTATADKLAVTLGNNTLNAPFNFAPGAPVTTKVTTKNFNLGELAEFVPMLEAYALGGSISSDLNVTAATDGKGTPSAIGSFSLNKVTAKAPLPAEEGQEPNSFPIDDISGTINFSEGEKVKTTDLKATLAGQTFALNLGAASFTKPKLVFKVTSDDLQFGPIASALGPSAAALKNSFIKQFALSGSYSTATGNGQVALDSGPASLADTPIDGLGIKTSITKDLLTVLPSSINIFDGKLNLGAQLTMGQQKLLTLAVSGGGMDAEKISNMALASSPVGLRGTVSTLKTNIKTNLASPLPTANGSTSILMVDGAITGVNIIGQTFNGIDSIPGINSALSSFVPEEHAEVLKGTETAFSDMTIDTLIGNSQLQLRTLKLTHPLYLITGTGNIGIPGPMQIRAQLRLTPTLSSKMVLKEPKLKLLQDRNGNMVIPIEIIKRESRVIVIPDAEELAKRAATNTAKEAAGRAIDRVAPGVGGIVDSLFK
ncbi:MAG: AsmA family protein [Bdellovibrionales bacterium]|nr:AsmA family protein [Bdellovibrionales bacterium]